MRRAFGLLIALLPATAHAAFTDLGFGARAPGMGDAFVAVADDVYTIAYNPAGLGTMSRPQLGATYARLFMGLTDGSNLGQQSLAYAQPLKAGANGTLAVSWQNFSLDSLYSERTIGFSYGRLGSKTRWGDLYWGVSLKQLSRSFGTVPEATNAWDGTTFTSQPDPLLAAAASKSAMDADVGLLLRSKRHVTIGFSVSHLNSPDVGFASPDPVPMLTRLGASYHTLWMNLVAEVRAQQSPIGTQDSRFTLGVERNFPTLDSGEFALRASAAAGSRSFEQLTAGASYQVSKLRFDYAFVMPVGSVTGTLGTHRFGLTFLFGGPTPEGEYAAKLVSQMSRAEKRAQTALGYERSDVQKPAKLDTADLAAVREKILAGRYHEAHELLVDIIKQHPDQPGLLPLARRLDAVAAIQPEAAPATDKAGVQERRAVLSFLRDDDTSALLLIAYARSLAPDDAAIARLVVRFEEMMQAKAETAPAGRNLWQELQARSEKDYDGGDYGAAAADCRRALVLEPGDLLALERLGSNLFVVGEYDGAAEAWTKALNYEKDQKGRQALSAYIEKAREAKSGVRSQSAAPKPASRPAAKAAAPEPVEAAPLEAETPEEAAPAGPGPRDLEGLYQLGVDYYARGELEKAAQAFEQVLSVDPENAPARKALDRIHRKAQ